MTNCAAAMYEQEIRQAITAVCTELDGAITQGVTNHAQARPYLTGALQRLVQRLNAMLGDVGARGRLGVILASNFLQRATFDLYGPCLMAGMLYQRGEWSVGSALVATRRRGVTATLFSLGRSVVTNVLYTLESTAAERIDALLTQILEAHADYAAQVVVHLQRDAQILNDLFGVTGGATALYFAGSDPHCCAHRVVLATYANGRVVYKPSDLAFQLLMMGSPESFNFQHRAMPHPVTGQARALQLPFGTTSLFETLAMSLPTVHIAARGSYGYMEFKRKAGLMNTDQIGAYYRKMGKLLAVASVFGITDLHEENIMATDDGPYIIDGEMGFDFADLGATPNGVLTKTSLNRALTIRPEQYSVSGGGFSPYWDAQTSMWEAHSFSLPYDPDGINAGLRSVPNGPWIKPRVHALYLLAGIESGVEGMAHRFDAAMNWLVRFRLISPSVLARVLLNTTNMIVCFKDGVAARINGTAETYDRARAGGFMNWMTWYAGKSYSVPAALYTPASRAVFYDPTGHVGATVVDAVNFNSAKTTQELQFRLGMMLMGGGVARTKETLRRGLATLIECPVDRLQYTAVGRLR